MRRQLSYDSTNIQGELEINDDFVDIYDDSETNWLSIRFPSLCYKKKLHVHCIINYYI